MFKLPRLSALRGPKETLLTVQHDGQGMAATGVARIQIEPRLVAFCEAERCFACRWINGQNLFLRLFPVEQNKEQATVLPPDRTRHVGPCFMIPANPANVSAFDAGKTKTCSCIGRAGARITELNRGRLGRLWIGDIMLFDVA